MTVYSYSNARQNLAKVLEEAEEKGEVILKRRDGRTFVIRPVPPLGSPMDVPAIKTNLSTEEIIAFVREGRDKRKVE